MQLGTLSISGWSRGSCVLRRRDMAVTEKSMPDDGAENSFPPSYVFSIL
jgi:hypothetical protein